MGRLNFAVLQHVAADKYLKTCGLTSVLQCRTRLQSFYTGFPILKCLWDSGPPENTVPANSSRMPIHFRGSLASYSKLLTLSNNTAFQARATVGVRDIALEEGEPDFRKPSSPRSGFCFAQTRFPITGFSFIFASLGPGIKVRDKWLVIPRNSGSRQGFASRSLSGGIACAPGCRSRDKLSPA